jgi:hypothetical protein
MLAAEPIPELPNVAALEAVGNCWPKTWNFQDSSHAPQQISRPIRGDSSALAVEWPDER